MIAQIYTKNFDLNTDVCHPEKAKTASGKEIAYKKRQNKLLDLSIASLLIEINIDDAIRATSDYEFYLKVPLSPSMKDKIIRGRKKFRAEMDIETNEIYKNFKNISSSLKNFNIRGKLEECSFEVSK